MPCYRPLQGYRSRVTTAAGKRAVVFNPADGFLDLPVTVACGQCVGCRLERSRQWAVRIVHEASLHSDNCFLTLTYDNAHLPPGRSLRKRDFQLFMKRLRKRFRDRKIKFFHCGEYGDETNRPHYHAVVFGFDFPDKVVFKKSRKGLVVYRSALLSSLWPYGHSAIGAVSFESAAYVARYCVKKVTGRGAEQHYQVIDKETGEVFSRTPEYVTMSLKPAIGANWIARFKQDVFPMDEVVLRGRKMLPPKYYLSVLLPSEVDAVKAKRVRGGVRYRVDQSPQRLFVRETVAQARLNLYKRTVE